MEKATAQSLELVSLFLFISSNELLQFYNFVNFSGMMKTLWAAVFLLVVHSGWRLSGVVGLGCYLGCGPAWGCLAVHKWSAVCGLTRSLSQTSEVSNKISYNQVVVATSWFQPICGLLCCCCK